MSSDIIITVENLASCLASGSERATARREGDTARRGKRYRLGAQSGERYTALRDVISARAAAPFRALSAKVGKWKSANGSSPSDRPTSEPSNLPTLAPSHSSKEDFWALKDVSFEVKQGEVLASGSEGPTARLPARRELPSGLDAYGQEASSEREASSDVTPIKDREQAARGNQLC